MSLTVGTDSFVSIEEAEGIVSSELYPDSPEYLLWKKLDTTSKEILLKKATRQLDRLAYKGQRDVTANKLKFPRWITYNGVYQSIVPYEIKCAVVLQGLIDTLDKQKDSFQYTNQGIKSMSVAGNSVTFDTVKPDNYVHPEVLDYIKDYQMTTLRY